MPKTEAQKRANKKYQKKAYDRISFDIKKGKRLILKNHAESRGESLAGFLTRAAEEAMQRDNNGQ